MIELDKFELANGLKVIVHHDDSTPFVAFNLLYDVGAKDENPEQTGFAHLFEHLMFSGSVNIPHYDKPLQEVGGENNAFTNNDITNYYITLPSDNIETAFWLESDRMNSLAFSEKGLEVQRQVVIEEYKQRYLNQPYGDVWLLLRPLAFKSHPYKWATIGKEISHIEGATMDDVKAFFFSRYAPNNAIISIVGDVKMAQVKELTSKWFANLGRRDVPGRDLPAEPKQTEARFLSVERNVPYHSIYKAYHMCERGDPDYQTTDLLSDVLSNGKSSRLNQRLVKEQKLFSNVNAFITGDRDPGLFVITGTLMDGATMVQAEKAIENEVEKIKSDLVSEYELEKVKNKVESNLLFGEMSALNKAMNLGYFELLGDAAKVNSEVEKYRLIKREDIKRVANEILRDNNCSTLHYLSKQ
jgi:zinc protease